MLARAEPGKVALRTVAIHDDRGNLSLLRQHHLFQPDRLRQAQQWLISTHALPSCTGVAAGAAYSRSHPGARRHRPTTTAATAAYSRPALMCTHGPRTSPIGTSV